MLEVQDLEYSAIHTACEKGDPGEIQAVLQDDYQAVHDYHDGQTALHTTVLNKNGQTHEVIHMLLEHGSNINAQTQGDEDTALHLVVERGDFPTDFSVVLMLLENDADITIRNKKLRTAYDCAVGKGDYELASTLDGSIPPNQAREFYLKKIGEKYGPWIIAAVLRSDARGLEESIHRGGNPNMLNKHGAGAIHYAITHCTLPVVQVLQSLIDADADVNLRDDEGDTALNLAIKSKPLRQSGNMIPVVTLLVQNGSDPSLKDLDGRDAFNLAEDRGYDDVLQILRTAGQRRPPQPIKKKSVVPSLDLREVEPETEPMVQQEDKEEFPDPNKPNKDGLYPIHLATLREDPEKRRNLIESLIRRGAMVSQVDEKEGNTALHICAQKNLGDTAEQLLQHHIDYTVKNKNGKKAYDIAQQEKHHPVMTAIAKKEKQIRDNWKKGKKTGVCVIL